jgi:hypothetical protein
MPREKNGIKNLQSIVILTLPYYLSILLLKFAILHYHPSNLLSIHPP